MNAVEIAKKVVDETKEVGRFVSVETRELIAYGKVAVIIDGMDESTSAAVKVCRLEDALREVRVLLR